MVEIHLYGKLRRLAPNSRAAEDTVIRIEPEEGESLRSLLTRAGISIEELYHISSTATCSRPITRWRRGCNIPRLKRMSGIGSTM